MRGYLFVQFFDRHYSVIGIFNRHKIFCLQFFACTWREAHLKMRKPCIPWSGHAHLFSAALRGLIFHRVNIFCRQLCSVKFWCKCRDGITVHPAFNPNLINVFVFPIGEQAYTVPARHNCLEIILERFHWQVAVNNLPHPKSWKQVKSKPGYDSQCT